MKLAILSTLQKLWTTAAALLAFLFVVMSLSAMVSPGSYAPHAEAISVALIAITGGLWIAGRRWMFWMFGVKP